MSKITSELEQQIKQTYLSGKNYRETAEIFKVSETTIYKIIKRNNIKSRTLFKLTPEREKQLLADYAKGLSSLKLAPIYGVSQSVVCDYIRRNGIKSRTTTETSRKIFWNQKVFDNPNSPEIAWFLGWMWSDGCNKNNMGTLTVTVHKKDVEVLEKLRKILGNDAIAIDVNKNKADLRAHSRYACKQLNKLGCVPCKSLVVELPTCFNEENFWHFLRGEIEGDGHIGINKKYEKKFSFNVSSGSLKFLLQLQNYIQKTLGIKTLLYERKNSNSKKIVINNRNDIIKLLNKVYFGVPESLVLKRKYEVYKKMCEIYGRVGSTRKYHKKLEKCPLGV